jgi:cytochrome d ubiquinol oxidase subunit I
MSLDPLLLSRIQFAWVIAWHFLLPAFTVGLASFIAVLEGLHLATGREIYFRISTFWIRIFAVSFGMGVVSGIVMPFQLGTNWSRYSDATANVISPLLAYEGLTAFFLEAAFLGVLLFGRNLVPRWAHFVAALMVALGTLASTFWILATNSWMQTPAGYTMVDGRFMPQDWLAIIFSPSFPYRLAHTVDAVYITTGFVVGRGLLSVAPALRRGGADHAVDGALAADRARPAADLSWRSARPQYARAPAGEARGDRGTLVYREPSAAESLRPSRRTG